jgi:hypothetical protein
MLKVEDQALEFNFFRCCKPQLIERLACGFAALLAESLWLSVSTSTSQGYALHGGGAATISLADRKGKAFPQGQRQSRSANLFKP